MAQRGTISRSVDIYPGNGEEKSRVLLSENHRD